MSQGRRPEDYRRKDDAQVSRVRREGDRPVIVGGYSPGGALTARPNPGDEKFPFVKDVPDVEGPFRLLPPVELSGAKPPAVLNPIPTAPFIAPDFRAALAGTGIIDVRGIRLLNLFVNYYPGSAGVIGDLILIPDTLIDTPPQAAPGQMMPFPIGVVDPTLTAPGTFSQGFARRRTYASEFNFSAGVIVDLSASGPISETLVFDVAPYDDIRFYYGERTVNAVSGLELFFLLER